MNRHSILVKLNILFAIALLTSIVAGFSIVAHILKKDQVELFFKSRMIIREFKTTGDKPQELFEAFNFTQIQGKEKREVIKDGKQRKMLRPYRIKRVIPYFKGTHLISYRGYLYLFIPKFKLLLKDQKSYFERFGVVILIFGGIIVLLIAMYIYLRKSLLPLKKLQHDIIRYGEGELDNYPLSPKKDEISLLSNAFYLSVEKVKDLTDSRQLFIRNLFHELNTPVTKGKILTEVTSDPKTKQMLNSIFTRLSALLKELAQMEKITSKSYTIIKKPIPIIELIDQAKDLLYLDEVINTNVTNQKIEADFSTMSIVFKNLIDNALKYGKNFKIIYRNNTISFISEGLPLKEDLTYYTQVFSKDATSQSQKGFGLGLYIVQEIVTKHKMNLSYLHKDGENWFVLTF